MKRGAIVLCGGASRRMGLDKATLPFGPELMVQRVVRLVRLVADPVIVVAAPAQDVPELPGPVVVVRDRRKGRGPLEGLLAGLNALQDESDVAYVTSCDVPLLVPDFAERMFDLVEEHQIAVPKDEKHYHPLAAVYRKSVLGLVQRLLDADRLRPFYLFADADTRVVEVNDLRTVDPDLLTLANLNRAEDYLAALARCGFTLSSGMQEILDRAEKDDQSSQA